MYIENLTIQLEESTFIVTTFVILLIWLRSKYPMGTQGK